MYENNTTCDLYHKCKWQAEYHYREYLKYLSYAKFYQQCNQHLTDSNVTVKNNSGHCSCRRCFRNKSKCNKTKSNEVDEQYIYSEMNTTVSERSTMNSSVMRKRRRKNRRKNRRSLLLTDETSKTENEEELVETVELEDNTAFKEFLKISAAFRKERDAARCLQENNTKDEITGAQECIEYVDVMRKGPEGTILPPTALNRKKLYEEKYGIEKGTTILSLETALQWNYNKYIDTNLPKPWPALPLKL